MISAATGDGLDRLRARLARDDAAGPWLYPEDQITDAPIRALAAEITREKLFERLHDELPYQTTVETDSLEGSARRLGAHRADDLRLAREPQEDRDRRGRAHIKAIGSAARKKSPRPMTGRCISSCSSRCAPTGSTIPSATARWASNSRAVERRRAARGRLAARTV